MTAWHGDPLEILATPSGGPGVDPLSMLSSLPSFTGGDAGPSYSSTGPVTAIMSAPFQVGGSGNEASSPAAGTGGTVGTSGSDMMMIAAFVVVGFVLVTMAGRRR